MLTYKDIVMNFVWLTWLQMVLQPRSNKDNISWPTGGLNPLWSIELDSIAMLMESSEKRKTALVEEASYKDIKCCAE